MNASEPLMTHRETYMLSKRPSYERAYEYSRNLIYWLCGNRCKGGMNFIWAFIWNRRVLCTDVSLSLKLPTKDSLTDKGKSTS